MRDFEEEFPCGAIRSVSSGFTKSLQIEGILTVSICGESGYAFIGTDYGNFQESLFYSEQGD